MSKLRRLLSVRAKQRLRRGVNQALPLTATSESAAAYAPSPLRAGRPVYHLDSAALKSPCGSDGLPVPPPELRMGYSTDSDEDYIYSGKDTCEKLRAVMAREAAQVPSDAPLLELGCATGRVLRHFHRDTASREIWGVDQHENSLFWAKANLSPPFQFVSAMRLPHLPFEDNYFGVIYGISVFTHIEFLVDAWLMELRRILAPGGCLLLTIHDESSVATLKQQPHPRWLEESIPLDGLGVHDYTVAPWGVPGTAPRHDAALPFYNSEYIRRDWGRYFARCEIQPAGLDPVQSLVILEKRQRG